MDAIHNARNDGGLRARIAAALWTRDYQPGPEASMSGYVYDLADRVAEVVGQARREAAEHIASLIEAVDPVEWALAGQRAGQDAARIAREAFPKGADQ
ncbi:hypothetical protein AB0J63_26705 [Streptosporangium canum]|uniref:hypothetical protein n=1 Tax=Streptosporangium canum TaxID=324952 RepID=UPI003447B616